MEWTTSFSYVTTMPDDGGLGRASLRAGRAARDGRMRPMGIHNP